jgi:excisionase family DNA binding protein
MAPAYNPFEAIEKRLSAIEISLSLLNENLTKEKTYGDGDIIDIDEVAKMLHISKDTVYTKTHKKTIPHWKEGKRLLFSKKRILSYIAEGEVKTFHKELKESERLISNRISSRQLTTHSNLGVAKKLL